MVSPSKYPLHHTVAVTDQQHFVVVTNWSSQLVLQGPAPVTDKIMLKFGLINIEIIFLSTLVFF